MKSLAVVSLESRRQMHDRSLDTLPSDCQRWGCSLWHLKLGHWEAQVVTFSAWNGAQHSVQEQSGRIWHLCEPPLIKTWPAPLLPTFAPLGPPPQGGSGSKCSPTSLLFVFSLAAPRGESCRFPGKVSQRPSRPSRSLLTCHLRLPGVHLIEN